MFVCCLFLCFFISFVCVCVGGGGGGGSDFYEYANKRLIRD